MANYTGAKWKGGKLARKKFLSRILPSGFHIERLHAIEADVEKVAGCPGRCSGEGQEGTKALDALKLPR